MQISESVKNILPSLAKLKTKLSAVTKDTNNAFFKSKYADLNAYLSEVEKHATECGLVLLQPIGSDALRGDFVSTTLFHVDSGEWVSSSMTLINTTDMQKAGSAVTYARRYTLGALLGMQAEDDDGNAASGNAKTETKASGNTNKKNSFSKNKTEKASGW